MSDQPPVPPTSQDFPDHWGFYLLQAINRLDDQWDTRLSRLDAKIETVQQNLNQRLDGLDAKIESVRHDLNQRIDHLDGKIEAVQRDVAQRVDQLQHHVTQRFDALDQKLTALQYWYWGTLVVILVGFVTLFLTAHP